MTILVGFKRKDPKAASHTSQLLSEEKNGRENREAVPLTPHGGQTHGGEAFGAPDLRVSQKGLTNPFSLLLKGLPRGKAGLKLASWGGKKGKVWSFLSQWFLAFSFILPIVKHESQRAIKGNLVSPFIFPTVGNGVCFPPLPSGLRVPQNGILFPGVEVSCTPNQPRRPSPANFFLGCSVLARLGRGRRVKL